MPKTKKKGKKPGPTWADVNLARKQGQDEGVDLALTILMTVQRDKFGMTDEEEDIFMKEMVKLQEELNEGRISIRDLKMVHLKEYGTDLR